jgi:cytochrome c551
MKRSWMVIPAVVLLSGCGGTNSYTPVAGGTPAQIYADTCAGCHGAQGEGKFGALLKLAGTTHAAADLGAKIRAGGPVMPAFVNISEADATAVGEYIRSGFTAAK